MTEKQQNGTRAARSKWSFIAPLIATLIGTAPAWAGGEFILPEPLPGDDRVVVNAITDNGELFAGFSQNPDDTYQVILWTRDGGAVNIGRPDGLTKLSHQVGVEISGNGRVVLAHFTDESFDYHAVRWTEADGWSELDGLGGRSVAYAADHSGNIIVGYSHPGIDPSHAIRWIDGVLDDLGFIPGTDDPANYSRAFDISADGSVIVGEAFHTRSSYDERSYQNIGAMKWTEAGGMVALPFLDNEHPRRDAEALAVSRDGSTIVGYSTITLNTDPDTYLTTRTMAVRWVDGTVHALGLLPDGSYSKANDVNQDGSVIVGQAVDPEGPRAFRWTEEGGMQTILDWLADNGVEVSPDVPRTRAALFVTPDGNTITGTLSNNNGFIATLSGMITIEDVAQGLGGTGAVLNGVHVGSLLLHGAHSQPLQRQIAAGTSGLWATGDIGRDDHDKRDGDVGLAEVGFAHNNGSMQINLSGGMTWAEQSMPLGGRVDAEGTFVVAEAILPVDGYAGLHFTATAYHQWGEVDITRSYLNAGLPDASRASPDLSGWGLRGRLDWLALFKDGDTTASPYIDLSYARTKIDAYTETGGGFPARFNARNDKRTELRGGANMRHPATESITLLASAEVAHRFEDDGVATSGQLVGLFAFNFANPDPDQTWVKGGLGFELATDSGRFNLMGNATSQGAMPSAWLSASYLMPF